MTFWKFIQAYPQLIAVGLAFVVPTLARILKKLGEQSAKRSANIKREQDEMESLRTGRAPAPQAPTDAPSARATLEEMAAKRRAQIDELRQRRQAQVQGSAQPQIARAQTAGQTPAPAARSAPIARQPRVAPPQRSVPTERRPFQAPPPQLPTAPARQGPPRGAPDPRAARLKAQREAQARQQAEIDGRQRAKQQNEQEHQRRVREQQRDRAPRMTQQAAADATAAAMRTVEDVATAKQELAATMAVARIPKRNIVLAGGDWKKAFIMQELLSPPLSLRS